MSNGRFKVPSIPSFNLTNKNNNNVKVDYNISQINSDHSLTQENSFDSNDLDLKGINDVKFNDTEASVKEDINKDESKLEKFFNWIYENITEPNLKAETQAQELGLEVNSVAKGTMTAVGTMAAETGADLYTSLKSTVLFFADAKNQQEMQKSMETNAIMTGLSGNDEYINRNDNLEKSMNDVHEYTQQQIKTAFESNEIWKEENLFNYQLPGVNMTVREYIQKYSVIKEDTLAWEVGEAAMAMIPTILVDAAAPGMGNLVFAAQCFGGSLNEAYYNGASEDEALVYALLTTAVEVGVEKISGGFAGLKNGKIAKNAVVSKVITKVDNSTVKKLLSTPIGNFIANAVGEGFEEALSDIAAPFILKLSYGKDEDIKVLWEDQNFGHDFLVGMLTSVVLQGASIPHSLKASIKEEYDNLSPEIKVSMNSIDEKIATDLNNPNIMNAENIDKALTDVKTNGNIVSKYIDPELKTRSSISNEVVSAINEIEDVSNVGVDAVEGSFTTITQSQKDALYNFEQFFKTDLSIKVELMAAAPNDAYNSQVDLVGYSDRLNEAIADFEFDISKALSSAGIDITKTNVKDKFNQYKIDLANAGIDATKLKNFYRNNFSEMDSVLVENVGEQLKGHTLSNTQNAIGLINNATTINEILHVLHSYVLNNNENYNRLPVLDSKICDNEYQEPINMYGIETDISRKLFENFPVDMENGAVDIISLSNKTIMMIRDVGHALTFEINKNGNMYDVNYYIPKISSSPIAISMLNALRGVNKINANAKYVTGTFTTENLNELADSVYGVIRGTPTDIEYVSPTMAGQKLFEKVAENSDFSTMKLIKDILTKMQNSDDVSTVEIANNFNNLLNKSNISEYFFKETKEIYGTRFFNYDQIINSVLGSGTGIETELYASREITSHELGHLLNVLVNGLQFPENYNTVIVNAKNNLSINEDLLKDFYNTAVDYMRNMETKTQLQVNEYIKDHPTEVNEFVAETLKSPYNIIKLMNETNVKNDELQKQILDNYNNGNIDAIIPHIERFYNYKLYDEALYINKLYDHEAQIYDMASGIIDSIYDGKNPYYHGDIAAHLRTHSPDYFEAVNTRSFDEQFADYFSMRINSETYAATKEILTKLVGEDWFSMMNDVYNNIASNLKQNHFNDVRSIHNLESYNALNANITSTYKEKFDYIIQNMSQRYPNWLAYLSAYIKDNGDLNKITRYNDCRLIAQTIPLSEFTRMYNELNISEILKSFSKDIMTSDMNLVNVVNQFLTLPGDVYHKLTNINTVQKSYPNKVEYDSFMNKYSEQNGYNICNQENYFKHIQYGARTEINHRLYINCEPTITYKFLDYFADACKQNGLSFYFKTAYLYNETNGYQMNQNALTRSESAVIYASSSDIIEYINICKQIKAQHPELSFYEPPIVTGSIDGWLGYGAEPSGRTAQVAREEGIANSFNSLRSVMLERGIYDGIKSCIKNNMNIQYLNGQTISNLYATELYKSIMNKYPSIIDAHKQVLFNNLNNNLNQYIDIICSSDKPCFQFKAQLNGHNNLDILAIDTDMINESLKNFHLNYTINDPSIYKYINFSIKKYARYFYIDENNLYLSE